MSGVRSGFVGGGNRRRFRWLVGVIGSLTLLAVVANSAAAYGKGDPSGTSAKTGRKLDPRMDKQKPLDKFIDDMQRFAHQNHYSGFVAGKIDVRNNKSTVFWHGDPPRDVVAHAEHIRGNVDGSVVPVPYSMDDLDKESRRIVNKYGPIVTEAGPNSSFTGLSVAIDPSKADYKSFRIESPMPITTHPGGGSHALASRDADTEPYWGGAILTNSVSGWGCSSGWSVNVATSTGSYSASLTALHCKSPGAATWDAGLSSRSYGTEGTYSRSTDAMLLKGKTYDPYVYDNEWDSTTSQPVRGSSSPNVGDYICEDGAWSGEACTSVRVDSINQYWYYSAKYWDGTTMGRIGPGFVAHYHFLGGPGIAGEGDSGGPAYRASSSGDTLLGMIQGIDLNYEVPCQGVTGRHCSTVAFNVHIANILNRLGAHTKTTN